MDIQGKQKRLVSVIIPTYNRAHFLEEMLGSVASQTYRPIEVIVVDDGSTDETPQIMERANKRFRDSGVDCLYIVQAKSNGSSARNHGFRLSRGEYLVFMDSDDYAHPEMIDRMVNALEKDSADFCVCDSARFRYSPGDSDEIKRLSRRKHSARAHLRSIALQTWFLAKRSVVDAIGPWNQEITYRDDVEYTFRILVNGFRGIWTPEVLYYWRQHDAQMSGRTDAKALASSMLALKKMTDYAKAHSRYTLAIRMSFGWEFARLGHACHRLGYSAFARQAEHLAAAECLGASVPFRLYRVFGQVMGENFMRSFRSFARRTMRRL